MDIDVGQAIQELLFEHSDVLVPGLGGFTSTPQTATADYVQGVVLPPTKKIEFNPNLVINDGVLVNHIQKQHTVTVQEAKEAVDLFVEKMAQSLERREIVEIPKVGRLYKDYEHKIRFMPENANLDASTFGLPPVQFVPVVRERPEPAPPTGKKKPSVAAATAQGPAKTPPSRPSATAAAESGLQRLLPWLVLASAILLAVSLFFLFRGDDGALRLPLDKTRVNVKPQEPEQAGQKNAAAPDGTEPGTSSVPESQNIPEDADTEINTYAPGKEKAFIVVHSFGKRSNATNFAKLLAEDGYAVENRTYKKLYRVGIIFPYSDAAEIDSMKATLGKKYKAGPKLFEELDE
jgi:CCDC81-like HU domain protein/sporulation related protein